MEDTGYIQYMLESGNFEKWREWRRILKGQKLDKIL
jgi:hypothetical protein